MFHIDTLLNSIFIIILWNNCKILFSLDSKTKHISLIPPVKSIRARANLVLFFPVKAYTAVTVGTRTIPIKITSRAHGPPDFYGNDNNS